MVYLNHASMPRTHVGAGAVLVSGAGDMLITRDDGLLSTNEAALRVGVAPGTFRCWRSRGRVSPDGLDEHGWPLYSEETAREAELLVRANGLRTSGIDPRRLRRSRRRYAVAA